MWRLAFCPSERSFIFARRNYVGRLEWEGTTALCWCRPQIEEGFLVKRSNGRWGKNLRHVDVAKSLAVVEPMLTSSGSGFVWYLQPPNTADVLKKAKKMLS